ncbi:Uncharacterised protein [Candidatus Tiddalikarchaeum anstoanum]|nr:Uncharacterised protein [Candidatus Tiddalikarchaeum anstoanum]
MKEIKLEIYADEIICPLDYNKHTKNIIGFCCLFLPSNQKQEVVTTLLNYRCLNKKKLSWSLNYNDCKNKENCKEEWHKTNDCEIHTEEFRTARASKSNKIIIKSWLQYLINKNNSDTPIFFNILFLELNKMDISYFGNEKTHENIYNKFFRTTIEYGLKRFFGNNKIIIEKVYHDKASMEHHEYFPNLNLKKLDDYTSENILFEDTSVHFINSDHKLYLNENKELYNESNLIQFVDLFLGMTSQNIYYLSDDELKKEYAMILRPLIKKILNDPYTSNQHISFYPKEKAKNVKAFYKNLDGKNISLPIKSGFYYKKDLELPDIEHNQSRLDIF